MSLIRMFFSSAKARAAALSSKISDGTNDNGHAGYWRDPHGIHHATDAGRDDRRGAHGGCQSLRRGPFRARVRCRDAHGRARHDHAHGVGLRNHFRERTPRLSERRRTTSWPSKEVFSGSSVHPSTRSRRGSDGLLLSFDDSCSSMNPDGTARIVVVHLTVHVLVVFSCATSARSRSGRFVSATSSRSAASMRSARS